MRSVIVWIQVGLLVLALLAMPLAMLAAPPGPGGPQLDTLIYIVGGSDVATQTTTGDVRTYDPVTNVLTVLSCDPWPEGVSNNVLPGGFAIYNNKLYILGGFQINVQMINRIWEFDPNRPPGTR